MQFTKSKPSSAQVVHEQAGNLLDLARQLEEASRDIQDEDLKKKLRELTKGVAESSRELSGISSGIAKRKYKY